MKIAVCKECPATGVRTPRPAPYPGPRCATHHRAKKKADAARRRDLQLQSSYGIDAATYALLYEAQGGRCAVYRCRATGKAKALAVDHDHSCQQSHGGIVRNCCLRGLLCGVHNQDIGRSGDDPEVFDSIAAYLRQPPARKVLAGAYQPA